MRIGGRNSLHQIRRRRRRRHRNTNNNDSSKNGDIDIETDIDTDTDTESEYDSDNNNQQSIDRAAPLDSKDILRELAKELAVFFKDVDWAPSDVAVGLILLKRGNWI